MTRNSKPYNIHMLVLGCCATGTINCQMIEGLDTGSILDGLNRFFSECCIPMILYPDEVGGFIKALNRGEVDIEDQSGGLRWQRGIIFKMCPPQGHEAHGRIERKIFTIQESLNSSGMGKSRTSFGGWSTIVKLIEREINQIPLGYLTFKTSENMNPLLRLLSPATLRLQTRSNRSPRSSFTIPNHPRDIMTDVDGIYQMWYHIWGSNYVPLIMGRSKWFTEEKNLEPNDIVWFKLRESEMSSEWRLGKVESVVRGSDGLVREANIAYKNVDGSIEKKEEINWKHMVVSRPIRNMVKLIDASETTLIKDMEEVKRSCDKVIEYEAGNESFELARCNVIGADDVQDYEEEGGRSNWLNKSERNFDKAHYFLHAVSSKVYDEQVFLL